VGHRVGSDSPSQFSREYRRQFGASPSEDVASADESAVSGTPTFFVNGRRHYGVYDINTLTDEVSAAKTRAQQLALTAAPG